MAASSSSVGPMRPGSQRSGPAGSGAAPADPDQAPRGPTRAGAVGAIALVPVLLVALYVEVLAAVADSLDDIHAKAHHVTGPLWLGMFALLGIAGPFVACLAAWHTRIEGKSAWQATLRAEMAFVLIGVPAALFLLMA